MSESQIEPGSNDTNNNTLNFQGANGNFDFTKAFQNREQTIHKNTRNQSELKKTKSCDGDLKEEGQCEGDLHEGECDGDLKEEGEGEGHQDTKTSKFVSKSELQELQRELLKEDSNILLSKSLLISKNKNKELKRKPGLEELKQLIANQINRPRSDLVLLENKKMIEKSKKEIDEDSEEETPISKPSGALPQIRKKQRNREPLRNALNSLLYTNIPIRRMSNNFSFPPVTPYSPPKRGCYQCSRSFYTQQALSEHVRTYHHNTRNFKCKFCNKQYQNPKAFNFHIRKELRLQRRRGNKVSNEPEAT